MTRRQEMRRGQMKISLKFIWYDFWVGAFYDRHKIRLYLCPLPMAVVVVDLLNSQLYWKVRLWLERKFSDISRHLPRISRPFPKGVVVKCPVCQTEMRITAMSTGEHWILFWECPEHTAPENPVDVIIDWFPFLFGYAGREDLEKVGIVIHD